VKERGGMLGRSGLEQTIMSLGWSGLRRCHGDDEDMVYCRRSVNYGSQWTLVYNNGRQRTEDNELKGCIVFRTRSTALIRFKH